MEAEVNLSQRILDAFWVRQLVMSDKPQLVLLEKADALKDLIVSALKAPCVQRKANMFRLKRGLWGPWEVGVHSLEGDVLRVTVERVRLLQRGQ